MTAEPKVFDPEVEALLREIAADPNSSLLRVTRPQAVKGLFERTERVSPGMTGLSSAERHLVQVHRNEVAHLLREVCRWRMLNDPHAGDKVCPFTMKGEPELQSPPSYPQRDLGIEEDTDALNGLSVLKKCVGGDFSIHTSSIALASHRLEPTDAARIFIGLDLTLRNRPRSALRLYRSLLEESADPLMRSIAWSNMGLASELLVDYPLLVECNRQSALTHYNPLTSLEWLHAAVRLELRDETLAAAAVAERAATADRAVFEWFLCTQKNRIQARVWSPTSGQTRFAHEISRSLPVECRRIADVFA